ncbi:hypothetical protein Tco_1224695 [Tanacetum coccineum]
MASSESQMKGFKCSWTALRQKERTSKDCLRWLSSGERRLQTPPKSSDLLIRKIVLVKLVGLKVGTGLETEVTEGGKEEA